MTRISALRYEEVRDNVKTVHLSTSFFQDWVILGH